MSTGQPQWRCHIEGCCIYQQWQPAASGTDADRKSHRHYMAEHYRPAHT